MRIGTVLLLASLSAILALVALVNIVHMDLMDAFYIAFTLGSTVSAILAMTEKEANIGTVAGFTALVLMIALFGPYLGLKSLIVFRTQAGEITIPIEFIPYLMLGLIAFFAVGALLKANIARLGLYVLSIMLSFVWFTVSDSFAKVLIATTVGLIASLPLLASRKPSSFMALSIIPTSIALNNRTSIVVDLSGVNAGAMLLMPLLMFIALDPFDIIKGPSEDKIEGLASIAVLMLVFLQLLSLVI